MESTGRKANFKAEDPSSSSPGTVALLIHSIGVISFTSVDAAPGPRHDEGIYPGW